MNAYEGVDANHPDRVSWAEGFDFPLLVVRRVCGQTPVDLPDPSRSPELRMAYRRAHGHRL